MERLTDQRAVIEPGTYLVLDDLLDNMPEIQSVSRKELYYRLGLIENALGKNYDLDRLRELIEADRDGRCVVLPVKTGETFYTIDRVRTLCHLGYYFDDYDCQGCEEVCDSKLNLEVGKKSCYNKNQVLSFMESQKTIYLSEKEAKAALKAMKEREEK